MRMNCKRLLAHPKNIKQCVDEMTTHFGAEERQQEDSNVCELCLLTAHKRTLALCLQHVSQRPAVNTGLQEQSTPRTGSVRMAHFHSLSNEKHMKCR